MAAAALQVRCSAACCGGLDFGFWLVNDEKALRFSYSITYFLKKSTNKSTNFKNKSTNKKDV